MVYAGHYTLSELETVQGAGCLQGQASELLLASGLIWF